MNIFFISHAEVNLPKPLAEMSLVDIRGVNPELLEIMFSAHTNNVKQDYLLCHKNMFFTLIQGKNHSDEFAYYRVEIINS